MLVTDRAATSDLEGAVAAALAAGVDAVQLREKDLPALELLGFARKLRVLTDDCSAALIVNDRVDVAVLSNADGVHLPASGIRATDARRMLPHGAVIGVSTHSLEEALRAEADGADYITFGPVFFTPKKAAYGAPRGIEALEEVARRVGLPVWAIGGIKADNAGKVLAAGARGIAAISALSGGEASKLVRAFRRYRATSAL